MKYIKTLTVVLFIVQFCVYGAMLNAQSAKTVPGGDSSNLWEIPFASSGNIIQLSVQNTSSIEAKDVSVTFNNLPSWLEFKSSTVRIKCIPAGGTGDAEFVFSVDKKAPAGKDTALTAVISTADGQHWSKQIRVAVSAPKDYKLYQNYPNPFNPSTKIAFELPAASHVRMIIYDMIGREVARVADENYPAGYSEVTWSGRNGNGERVSSGMYIYRISAGSWNKVKKMMLLK